MYGQSNHNVGQGSQAPRPTTFLQPNQPGPPLYRPQAPLYHPGPPLYHPGQAPLQTPNSSHFRPQNVKHNHPPFHGRPPHPPLPPPPPPPVPHGNAFYQLPPYPGGRPAILTGDNASAFDGSRNLEVGRGPANPASSNPVEAKVVIQGVEELCASNGDSDMEMEDDITVPDKDQDVNHSTEVLVNAKEIGVIHTINAPQILQGSIQVHHIPTEFSNLHEKSEGSKTSKSIMEVSSQAMDLVHNAECPLNPHIGKSVSLADKLSPSSAYLAADTTNSKTHPEFIKIGSPMRLIQDYASDDSLENDDELLYKDMRPSRVLPSIIVAELVPNKDTSSTLETETGSKIRNIKEKGKEGSENVSKSLQYNNEDGISFNSTGKANNCGNRSPARDATGSSKRGNTLKESEDKKAKTESASLKVDEFGRVVREASSDSDSDSRYGNRRERRTGRDRGRSRSRSPLDRRRTRRSPRRRKDKRSRSRSWSPRNRRSRSRSPTARRSGEFSRGKFRSNKVGRAQECFDFIRGKCLRGAACRYIHRVVDKSDSSRSYRSSEKHTETRSGTKGYNTKQEETKHTSVKQPERVYDDTPTSEVQERKVDEKREDAIMDSGQTIALGDGGELVNPGTVKCEIPRDVSGSTRELKIVLNKPTEPNSQVQDYKYFPERSHEPQSNNTSVAEDQVDDCSVFDDLPNQTTLTSSKNIPNHDSVPNHRAQTGSLPSVIGPAAVQFPGPNISHESPRLPPPPPPPLSHGANVPHMLQFPMGYGSMPMPHSMSYPHQFGHRMNPHQFSAPPNPTWSLPPPPPRPPYDSRFTHGVSSQFHPSHFSTRPYPTESMGLGDPRSQSGDRFSHPTVQGLSTSTSLGHGNLHHQSAPFLSDPSSAVLPKSSTETHSFSHVQQASNHLQYPLGDSSLDIPGKAGGVLSQYLPDHEDNNKLSSSSNFGLPRIIPHRNPYASTFEKPLGSKFGSGFYQDKVTLSENQYDAPLKLASVDGQAFGSRPTTSSPCSARALEKVLLRGDGEQYDPLFDSVETQSNAKSEDFRSKNWDPASDSDPVERHGDGYSKPFDMDGTSRHEVTAVASTTSLDNDDEFGETAEAGIGAVENESPSDIAGAEIEMETESKSPGKKKKNKKKKDSRSTKPFKMAIADFVKDVLKPSWQQGNMSKEAFKTIVKKTVDKVSGAMKGHTVPKSQSKIDQYLFSSQRKLTKLVLGYVDKYVKV